MDKFTFNMIKKEIEILEDLEDFLAYNLSYGVSIKDSLEEIKRLDLLEYFNDIFDLP
jgi:hypothetical protein